MENQIDTLNDFDHSILNASSSLDIGQHTKLGAEQPRLSHYDVLGVHQRASRAEIREAYLRLKNAYSGDSPAFYSLMNDSDAEKHTAALEDAFTVLSDDKKRQTYDQSLKQEVAISAELPQVQTVRRSLTVVNVVAKETTRPDIKERMQLLLQDCQEIDGATLVRLRETANVSMEEVRDRTKISLGYLHALENDLFERLPQPVYVRGFLRCYLRYLGVPDLEKTVKGYMLRLEAWLSNQKG